jgi:DNA invertase Pin-like site-specific DNA recombinase
MLTVLAGLAEFERELIKARTGEGRKHAIRRCIGWSSEVYTARRKSSDDAPANSGATSSITYRIPKMHVASSEFSKP